MFTRPILLSAIAVFIGMAPQAGAETSATLQSSDTTLRVAAGPRAPRIVSLQTGRRHRWICDVDDVLIDHAETDGRTVPVVWTLNEQAGRRTPDKVSFVYESQSPKLRLTWEWQVRAQSGPAEHQVRIENLGGTEIWIPLQRSLSAAWRSAPDEKLRQFYVEKGADTPSAQGAHRVAVTEQYQWGGYSSTYGHPHENEPREIIPWFLLERDASEDGLYLGIEFSGRTSLTLARAGGKIETTAGLNPEPGNAFRTRLAAGAAFEAPTVFLGAFTGGEDGAGNILRPWVRQVLGNPRTWADRAYPLTTNNSWGSGMEVDAALARHMIADSAELGLEMFHLDAGWFRSVGDWYPDAKKFPEGLAAIADEAHRHGLKFGLWVDWAQAGLGTGPGALNARDPRVATWLVTPLPENWKPEPFKGQTIDIGVPAAHDYAQGEVQRIVRDYKLDMLEHDGYLVAQGCTRNDHPHAPPQPTNMSIQRDSSFEFVYSENSTDVSYHAVRAYYDIYERLRATHPELLLEICNDGGRMVDFGSAAHGDYFSITDTYDPLSNRRAFYDTSHVLPAAMLESYVERWPVPRIENFLYMLRSGMMGWFSVMQDTNAWTKQEHALAKEEIALYKDRLRPLIRDASLYHVSDRPDGVHWDAIEYFDSTRDEGVVFAFRGSSPEEGRHTFVLQGLEASRIYQVRFHDHSSADRTMRGGDLMTTGIKVALSVPNSSELIFLTAR